MAIKRENITTPIYTQATLGGRSEFEYAIEKGKLLLRFGRMTNFLEVKSNWIQMVHKRIEETSFSTTTSLYNRDKWGECPNNRTCPYVACLIINQKYKL
jgi:hypothetical protein